MLLNCPDSVNLRKALYSDSLLLFNCSLCPKVLDLNKIFFKILIYIFKSILQKHIFKPILIRENMLYNSIFQFNIVNIFLTCVHFPPFSSNVFFYININSNFCVGFYPEVEHWRYEGIHYMSEKVVFVVVVAMIVQWSIETKYTGSGWPEINYN